jgi:DNA invertase Pin-like site-specific DNA recombinase
MSGQQIGHVWVVIIVALDRLGRSMTHVVLTIEELQARGIFVQSLREGVDFSQPLGKMLAGIFASWAQYERELIR